MALYQVCADVTGALAREEDEGENSGGFAGLIASWLMEECSLLLLTRVLDSTWVVTLLITDRSIDRCTLCDVWISESYFLSEGVLI